MESAATSASTDEDRLEPGPALLSREPWWAQPPRPGQSEQELQWGYLEHYADGSFRFDPTRPTDEEIRNRKSCWMSREP